MEEEEPRDEEEQELEEEGEVEEEEQMMGGKLLVSNQVLVTARMENLRKQAIRELDLDEDAFRQEPTVFTPKLTAVIKNIDIKSILQPTTSKRTLKASIPLLCIHTDEGQENNIDDLLEELRSHQLEYNIGHGHEAEEEAKAEEDEETTSTTTTKDAAPVEQEQDRSEQRSTRFKNTALAGWVEENDIPKLTVQPRERPKVGHLPLELDSVYIFSAWQVYYANPYDDEEEDEKLFSRRPQQQAQQDGRERRRFTEEEVPAVRFLLILISSSGSYS